MKIVSSIARRKMQKQVAGCRLQDAVHAIIIPSGKQARHEASHQHQHQHQHPHTAPHHNHTGKAGPPCRDVMPQQPSLCPCNYFKYVLCIQIEGGLVDQTGSVRGNVDKQDPLSLPSQLNTHVPTWIGNKGSVMCGYGYAAKIKLNWSACRRTEILA